MVANIDDAGTQASLPMSPKMLRQALTPIHPDGLTYTRIHTRIKSYFHSDRNIFPLIDIPGETAADILNPIRTSAGNMSDLATLKSRHSKGVLHCNAIGAHRMLPRGASGQGQNEVGRAIGLVVGSPLSATAHSIKGEDQPVSIPVIDESMEKLGRYPSGGERERAPVHQPVATTAATVSTPGHEHQTPTL